MNIGVIYSIPDTSSDGREIEKLADCDVLLTANAVKSAFENQDNQVELLNMKITRTTELRRFDWIFNLAETVDGLDLQVYEIAEQMESLGIPFTGSGSTILKLCSDKAAVKKILSLKGVRTPEFEVFEPGSDVLNQLDFPLIAKPMHEDGSIGIFKDSVVWSSNDLVRVVHRIHHRYHQAALIEEYIDGRDISISILGNPGNLRVFPPSEVVYLQNFEEPRILTFDTKWVEGSHDYQNAASVCPCDLEPEIRDPMMKIAVEVYELLGCRDYARVDFRLKGSIPYVLEVNPNPCINPDGSGFVLAAGAGGYPYNDLILEIFNRSMKRPTGLGVPFQEG